MWRSLVRAFFVYLFTKTLYLPFTLHPSHQLLYITILRGQIRFRCPFSFRVGLYSEESTVAGREIRLLGISIRISGKKWNRQFDFSIIAEKRYSSGKVQQFWGRKNDFRNSGSIKTMQDVLAWIYSLCEFSEILIFLLLKKKPKFRQPTPLLLLYNFRAILSQFWCYCLH